MKDYKPTLRTIIYCITVLILGILVVVTIKKGNSHTATHSRTGYYFNTTINISLYDKISDSEASSILDECMKISSHYEDLFSRTKEGSDVYRINEASAGEEISVDEETASLLNTALYFASLSNGVVDPTIGALTILWNIGEDSEDVIPSKEDIDNALLHVDYKNIKINDTTVIKSDPDLKVDLGFIAKGYIADSLRSYLISEGIENAIINLGGNILCIGDNFKNGYNIGITDPVNPQNGAIKTLNIKDQSVVSSGNYERYFIKDGVRYHHILSTKDGYPANKGLSQVTIISDDSVTGDALSTLLFILGYDEGSAFVSEYFPDVTVIFADEDGKIL